MSYGAPESWQEGPLSARRIAEHDLTFLKTLFADPAMLAHRPDPRPLSDTQIAEQMQADLYHWCRHGIGRYVVAVDGLLVGTCGLTVKPPHEGLNLSYHIMTAHWGAGYATQAARGLVRIAKTLDPPPHSLFALIRPANPASARVVEKLGFTRVGREELHGAMTERWALPI